MRHSIFIWYFFVLVQGQNQEPPCQAPDSNNNWVYTSSSDNPNYVGTPGVWYYISNQKADIYSFDQYCKSLNSNMAKIFTQKENDFLTDLLINSHNAWLAGHMVVQNNTFENWYWFNNADANNDGNEPDCQLIEYFNWDQGQPITKNGKSWITINGDKKDGQTPGKWTARTPDNVNYFLCESRCPDTNNDPEPGTVLFEYGNSKNFTSDSDAHREKQRTMCALIIKNLKKSNFCLGCRFSASKYLVGYGKISEKFEKIRKLRFRIVFGFIFGLFLT